MGHNTVGIDRHLHKDSLFNFGLQVRCYEVNLLDLSVVSGGISYEKLEQSHGSGW